MRSMRASNSRPAKPIGRFSSSGDDRERRPRLLDLSSHSRARRARRVRSSSAKRPSICSSFTAAVGGLLDRRREVALQRGGVLERVPQVLHQRVHQLAALRGVEAFGGLLELLGVQAVAREGAERARGLVGENAACRRGSVSLPDGGRYAILKSFGFPGSEDHVAQSREGGNLDRLLGKVGDERARQDVAVLLPW